MNRQLIAQLCQELMAAAGLGTPTGREPIRVWELSGVERLRLTDGRTVVFKYAVEPFTGEDELLAFISGRGVPVPSLHASIVRQGVLGMIMEDLGDPCRQAAEDDVAEAAACLHAVGPASGLPTLGQNELQALPAKGLAYFDQLRVAGRFTDATDIGTSLHALASVASRRAAGAELPPFGMCHGELHPTSVHIGPVGLRLLDFAKAFNGPGLLDLATWQGTRHAPDPAQLRRLIRTYVAAGGHRAARADRGHLPAEIWALSWHRVWAASWFLEQAARGVHTANTDQRCIPIVRRQLDHAMRLLAP